MADVKALTETMRNASSWEEFKNAYMAWVKLDTELSTAQSVVHIRNTVNMLDEYYEAENSYFNAQMPKYGVLVKEMGAVVLDSPYRADMEKEFGKIRSCRSLLQDRRCCYSRFPRRALHHLWPVKAHEEHRPRRAQRGL